MENKGLLYLLPKDIRLEFMISSNKQLKRLFKLRDDCISYNLPNEDINYFNYKIELTIQILNRKNERNRI